MTYTKNWTYRIPTQGDWAYQVLGDQKHVCFVDGDNAKENAQLIASAPEMLEALKDIIKHDGGAYDLEPRQSEVILKLIARVEGR